MANITLYQCIPSYRPMPTARLIRSLISNNCKILIDLEDSIQDVQYPSLTPELKAQARKDFADIARNLPSSRLNLRINSIRSDEFQHDKKLLQMFGSHIESVFIPKVENSKDIEIFEKEFGGRFRLNLIVETRKGVNNLDEILSGKHNSKIDFIFFGNYDFHLDSNIYPVTEQYTHDYWKIIEPIITKIENHKLNFGNSPYANIADIHCLDLIVKQLTKLCKRNFALMSLHKTQTAYFQKLIMKRSLNKIHPPKTDNSFTLDLFTKTKQRGRSFALNNNRIITPQEYLLLFRKQNG